MSALPEPVAYARRDTLHGPWWFAWSPRGVVATAEGEWDEAGFRALVAGRTGAEPAPGDPGDAPRAIDWSLMPGGFRGQVLRACAEIPPGEVRSYGELADAAGRPRAARAVGTAMATNPVPLVVPCHRVVRGDMRIGEYGAGGPVRKAAMLRAEGVVLRGDRVVA